MEKREPRYPVGIETFADVINGGYVYVDKSRYIKILQDMGKYFFVSRPRRFGKSLFVSMMESYFEGRRDLFKGLDADRDDLEWTPRPVIKLTFNDLDTSSELSLTKGIGFKLSHYEDNYGIEPHDAPLPQRFQKILQVAYETSGRGVAVLIDEYDSPLLSTIEENHQELNQRFRDLLKPIFTVLKSGDKYVHFAFITGVSRFSHTSLFSGANNIPDLTLDDRVAAICGITESELITYFSEGIEIMADSEGVTKKAMIATLKENYDGYHFSKNCPDIYNPYSLIRTLSSKEIGDFWFQSGTPSFLIKILKRDDFFLPDLDCSEVVPDELTSKESYLKNPVTIMYESGYLTIKGYEQDEDLYTLGIPNKEVSKGLAGALLPAYSNLKESTVNAFVVKMRKAVVRGEADLFMSLIQTFLEGNPYSNSEKPLRETYFKNNLFIIFKMLGFSTRTEEETCRARTDMVMKTRKFIYVFELKADGSPEEALAQIEDRGYANPYRHDGRTIIKIGANYSTANNNIDGWVISSFRNKI